jgi:nitroreductase
MNEVINAILTRRSVRRYEKRQIESTALNAILEAGIHAPTAHNQQPWFFTVVQNEELLDRINRETSAEMAKSDNEWVRTMGNNPDFRVTYDAPTLIVVSGQKGAMAYPVDCSAAMQNMLLAAHSLGIGSVWLGLLRFWLAKPEAAKLLNIPEGYEPFYGAAFGYPAGELPPAPERNRGVINYIV